MQLQTPVPEEEDEGFGSEFVNLFHARILVDNEWYLIINGVISKNQNWYTRIQESLEAEEFMIG